MPIRRTKRAYAYLENHPYRSTFLRAMRLGMLRATWVKLLAGVGAAEPLHALLILISVEWVMSLTTSGAVGHRLAHSHLANIDKVWATGNVLGLLAGVFLVHLIFHLGRYDPPGCLMNW